jgi:hypothetical protein
MLQRGIETADINNTYSAAGQVIFKKNIREKRSACQGAMRKQMPCWPGRQATQSLYGKNKALAHSADNK